MLQLRDFVHHLATQDRGRSPSRGLSREGGRHDVLGQAVQPVRQLATPGWPPRGKPLVAPPTQQQSLGAQRLVERELGQLWAARDHADPAADPEALITGRVLDDSVERDVVAHDDLSHVGSPFWLVLSATPPRAAWVVRVRVPAGYPGSPRACIQRTRESYRGAVARP